MYKLAVQTFGVLAMLASTALAQDRPQIVTVNYPLQYFAERLVGDAADVVFPVPADVDPSFWRPSISDISTIQSADLILLNGAAFATWVDRVSLPRSKVVNTSAALKERYIITESITHSHGDGDEHSHEGLASYLWLAPELAIAQAEAVASGIKRRGIVPEADLTARMADLREDLETLGAAMSGMAGAQVIATHPRYQYFAQRADVKVDALEWEAGAMPSPEELDALKTLMDQTGATVLMWEAAPPLAGIAAATELGLKSVVFEPMAHPPVEGDFVAAYTAALSNLSQALGSH